MTDKLNITYEMQRFDLKDRDFFDDLDEQEQKKFSPYLMIRWGSCVQGDPVLESYYLMSTNEQLNKNFFDISTSKHKKFQWLMATSVSPGMGSQRHNWISPKKKTSNNNKTEKFLAKLYPYLKPDEIKLMARINDKKDIKELAKQHGLDDKQIKEFL